MTDDQSNYICNDDDLNSLADYFTAALAGEESKSRLQQMWDQEIGIIKATRYAPVIQRQELTGNQNTPDDCEHCVQYKSPMTGKQVYMCGLRDNSSCKEVKAEGKCHFARKFYQQDLTGHDAVIRRDERKQLLRLIKEWQRKHCYWFRLPHTDGEQRYHFDPAAFKEFLESLVATDPVPGSKKEGE